MRTSLALAVLMWLSGCAVLLLPVRAVESGGSAVIRSVTPDASDMR